jgi:hypothetical protein
VCRFLKIEAMESVRSDSAPASIAAAAAAANENRSSRAGLLAGYYAPPLRPLIARLDRRLPGRLLGPSQQTREALCNFYRDENERLFELLGRRIPSWQR